MNLIFDDAKAFLVTNGWRKGSSSEDSCCVVNALGEVAGSRDEALWAAETLNFLALSMWPARCAGPNMAAANFNDHPNTLFSDVTDLLDAAHAHEQERAAIDNEDGLRQFVEDCGSYNELTA